MNNIEQISCFCGHIFTLTVKNDIKKNESTVDVKKHKFSFRTNAFSVTNQQISFIAQRCLRVAALEICLHRRLGLYKLNILLISYPNFTICSIDALSKFEIVAKYDLSNTSDNFKSVRKFFLSENNTACFNLGADQIVVLHGGSVRTYSTEVHFIILDCRAVDDFLVLIGKTTENDVSLITLFTSLSSHGKLLKCGSRLIPDFYASVLTYLKIVDLDVDVDAVSLDPQFNGSALACTSYGQLIECRSGQLCTCAALPFCDGCDIRRVNQSSNQFDRSIVVVLSAARSCCVLDLKTSQVLFALEDVGSVLVDDFVGRGAEQILFLPRETRHQSNIDVVSMVDETCNRDLNSGFLLTDLAGLHVDKWTSIQDCEKPLKSKSCGSCQAAVEALDSRLLAGRAMVNEAHHSCFRKLTVIEETSEALRNMTLGETLGPHSRNTLVPLIGNQITGNQPSESPITRVAEAERVTTGALWQRIVDRKLVIGVQVHNATDSSIDNVELLLFYSASVTEELSTTSRCLHIEPSSFTDAHLLKRSRTEPSDCERYISSTIIVEMEAIPTKGNASVLVSCDLPLFQPKDSVTFKVILAWRKVEGSGSGNASHLRMIQLSKAVGEVSVDVENVVRGTWNASFGGDCGETKSGDVEKDAVVFSTASADLLSLHCIQMGLRLRMSSGEIAFPCLLLTSLQSAQLGFAYVDRHECFVCTINNHPLFLACLRILRIRYNDLVVDVFVRDPTQWTILLQSLFKLLPNDVTVAMDTTNGVVRLCESVVLAIRQELLITHCMEPASSFADNKETDESRRDVAGVRSDFESRRRKFVDRTLVGVGESRDEGYPVKVIEMKQNTDRLMMLLAQVVGNC